MISQNLSFLDFYQFDKMLFVLTYFKDCLRDMLFFLNQSSPFTICYFCSKHKFIITNLNTGRKIEKENNLDNGYCILYNLLNSLVRILAV